MEKAMLTVVALHLCFLPWALGTMHPWSQITSMALSSLGFVLALIPRHYSTDLSGGPEMRLTMWPRLFHFPVFWIGLALFGYITLQALNPSWVWQRNATTWWLRRVNDIPWLPTSIDTPFERFNIWRQAIIYASAWLTACTLWTGFTRRRSLYILLTVLALNGIILTAVGFSTRFYFPNWEWVLGFSNQLEGASSFSSFIYKNHAAAYLSLMVGAAITLAAWHHERGLRNMARSTPGMLWLLAAMAMAVGVFFTYSRGATLILAGYLVLAAGIHLVARLASSTRSTASPFAWLFIIAIFVATLGFGARQLNSSEGESRLSSLFAKRGQDTAVAQRLDAYAAAQSLLASSWQRGVGAGGFRYIFPEHIKRYPDSYQNGRLFWEHAHCDWLQLPIEMGVGGAALVLLGGLWIFLSLFRLKLWLHPAILLLIPAILQTLVHAIFDFPFQNPAILSTWLALLVLSLRWVELESA